VILKNDNVLPLARTLSRIALIGPLVDASTEMIGPWHAAGNGEGAVSLRQGIQTAFPKTHIECSLGVPISNDDISGIAKAVKITHEVDVIILFVGESRSMSGEASSRGNPALPGRQEELARAITELEKPVVVIIASGRPIIIPDWLVKKANAIVSSWFLGSEAGNALADVLTGSVNPTGRLPISWPAEVGQIPIFLASRRIGRPPNQNEHFTSKYLDLPVEPLFPFGHGLSYAQFSLSNLRAEPVELRPGTSVRIAVEVTNNAAAAGEETILLFIRDPVATVARPVIELRGISRIALAPRAKGVVRFDLASKDVMFVGVDGNFVLESGTIELLVGKTSSQAEFLRKSITIFGF
jgi:beta-glucosidase